MSDAGNQLARETSPYLLQHQDNPVHWQPWGKAALDRAKAENKPILLSVGYAACHWCHVMAHESFEDEATATLMNRLFVNIKVDREERPDIDHIYQSALAMLGEQGGWPLTMFLTPDGEPFWGGTYFPSEARYGRPSFASVLEAIAEAHAKDPERVQRNVQGLREGLAHLSKPVPGEGLPIPVIDQIAEQLLVSMDKVHGGFGQAPKFPQPGILMLLWRAYLRRGEERFRRAVTLTLDRMCQGGIYDHLGGGFARYSTDAEWLAPHFEKMLYDNAQMIEVLTHAWQETGRPLYRQRIEETIDWLQREMVTAEGGFASTLDADSEGEEGRFYVWSEAEIDAVLADFSREEREAFKQAYDVTPGGNWEEKTILHRNRQPELGNGRLESLLAKARLALLERRDTRVRPGWDDKVLADWNGLMIRALARAAFAFNRPEWLRMAATAFEFVATRMVETGRLRHSWRQDTLKHPATLEDYANMIAAALTLHQITTERRFLDQAKRWLGTLETHYADPSGGYFATADDTDDVILRAKNAHDNATPSGNGTMLGNLVTLSLLTGDPAHEQKAQRLLKAFSGEVTRNFFPLAGLINAAEFLQRPIQLVVAGPSEQISTQALRHAAAATSLPDLVYQQIPMTAALPPSHPASAKKPKDGRSAGYLCIGPVCSLPFTDPASLSEALRRARKPS
ncbi:MAG: thioredoxin domain-containing protein [Alphaproteobacteria bacterium]|nr:thioredoxin domain-containing protein [Alphaproteobacteria bacterium]MBU0798903.1 thioredoxin domain-containing protein [Alphaproteobacteria bacterium]MBU0886291.1 thioredoxin domain-containing protein [Alphaproteobacteria bacterium]MBU1813513.1 thioredoxin domain-containing protein [Alphaproteobacteria bacterium]